MLMTFSDFMAFKEMVLDYRGVSYNGLVLPVTYTFVSKNRFN